MFFKSIDKRIKIVLLIVIMMFVVIVLKVAYIQLVNYVKLNELASDLWSRELPIAADRGRILDRNGIVLADNITTTSLVLIPNQITDKEQASISLSKILGVSKEEMDKHVYKETSIERVHPEGRRLSYEVADEIDKLNLSGVYLVKESKRYYPYGSSLSHVLGYVGIDNQGLSGLELEYDSYLTGENGAIKYFSDAKGNTLKALLPVIDNFDRALQNQTDDVEVYRKGEKMTVTQLKEILKNMDVEAFGEVGDEFDPNIHSAVMTVENDELPENSIAAVFEKGYKMGDRILRFATVQVTN